MKDLDQKGYHLSRCQQLQQPDYGARINWATTFLANQATDPHYEDEIWWSDEAHCHISGHVNSHNAVYWGSQKPTTVIERPLHPIKVTIWCAMSSHGVLGPYFIEENGVTVTVNGARYLDMLDTKFYPDFSDFAFDNPELSTDWYFQQDGARPHITRGVRAWIFNKFGIRTIGEYLNNHWPARSPDLTPMDFFLWGWVKEQLYQRYPIVSRAQLKARITDIIRNMDIMFATNACRSVKRGLKRLWRQEVL